MESTALRGIVTPDDLTDYARTLHDKKLVTLHQKKRFMVAVEGDSLIYIPAKSGDRRCLEKKRLQAICDRFSENISFSPKDYTDTTFDSSYTLTLIAMWTVSVPAPQQTKDHVAELIHREKTTGLSPDEKMKLDHYMEIEHFMRLAKARASRLLSRG